MDAFPGDFESDVMRTIHRKAAAEPTQKIQPISLSDALAGLFPRLATVAALVILLCVATDLYLSTTGGPDLPDGIAAISEQWLFAVN